MPGQEEEAARTLTRESGHCSSMEHRSVLFHKKQREYINIQYKTRHTCNIKSTFSSEVWKIAEESAPTCSVHPGGRDRNGGGGGRVAAVIGVTCNLCVLAPCTALVAVTVGVEARGATTFPWSTDSAIGYFSSEFSLPSAFIARDEDAALIVQLVEPL